VPVCPFTLTVTGDIPCLARWLAFAADVDDATRQVYQDKAREYLDRSELLKRVVKSRETGGVGVGSGSDARKAPGMNLDEVLDAGSRAAKAVVGAAGALYGKCDEKFHVGDRVTAGVVKAKELNEEYDISGKAVGFVTASVEKARALNEEYRVVDRTKAAAAAGVAKAKELDERHHIVEKAGTIAAAAAMKAKELDSRFGISATAGSLLLSALNATAAAAQRVVEASNSSPSGEAATSSASSSFKCD
jgi:hypothetical protein